MGQSKHDGLAIPGRVVLAHEPRFTVGKLSVYPPTLQLVGPSGGETIEPRIMQVLVALARAQETIVTRDELIHRCWQDRIVTDDAINRVLSRIRQIGSGVGRGSFRVETITRVGYRLIEHPTDVRSLSPAPLLFVQVPRPIRRRAFIGGTAAVAVATLGVALWDRLGARQPLPIALELFRRGDRAQRVGTPEQTRQSVSYFEEAVRADPQYADAWGALALAYTHGLDGFGEAERASLPARIRSAAGQALKLDPDNADAQLALISVNPVYRNWSGIEKRLQLLCARYPEHWLAHGRLAMLYYQVGRLNDGIKQHQQMIAIDPMIAGPHAFMATALTNAGRMQEADTVLRQAMERWPAHPHLWITRCNHLMFSGRPKAAVAFLMDPDALPSGFGPVQVEPRLTLARAVEFGRPADVKDSVTHQLRLAHADPGYIPIAAAIFSLLGRLDLTFASLQRYYLNHGSFGGLDLPILDTPLHTDPLFSRPMAAAREDARFLDLTRTIGLESYWGQAGVNPDYRQAI